MDSDSFQFIIESPQHTQGHKKRPRLVTSCDNCRLKKIKCLQPSPETKCEACKTAKIPCRFRDRERYFAERSRAISGPSSSPNYVNEMQRNANTAPLEGFSVASPPSSRSSSSYTSRSPKPSGIVAPDDSASVRYAPYGSETRRSVDYSHRASYSNSSARQSPLSYGSVSPSPAPMMHHHHHSRSSSGPRQSSIFDPDNNQFPNFQFMSQFITLFFQHLGNEYPFIVYEDVWSDFMERRLSAPMANSIAALAVQYSVLPELTVRGPHNVAEAYVECARNAISPVAHIPSVDTMHACMLLAWYEYRLGRYSAFRDLATTISRLSTQLGFTAPHGGLITTQDGERRKWTLKGLYSINMTLANPPRQ
ncbi:hypothetical protein D9758_008496 [Tetrapyrgos nigripes]|uniref:Zn(2)-C6 fungal-type domain-containing protein n=1 Tax=Tetrapyrgos nigripes TaxID=182062 RepID=A0A8H5CNW9_9AGAR|nr:hypothetical protein D9758_008496 [Tetrapyrgos nigripes]